MSPNLQKQFESHQYIHLNNVWNFLNENNFNNRDTRMALKEISLVSLVDFE